MKKEVCSGVKELSIVTPTLNSSATLRSTIESIRSLVEGGAQHIVVDGGSEDETLEIASMFGSEILEHPKGNMYEAINKGIRYAKGSWLTYINSDDLLYADYVRSAIAGASDETGFIYGDIDIIDLTGRYIGSRRSPMPVHLHWLMQHYSCVPQQGTLFRRSVYESLGGYEESYRYISDRDFVARGLKAGIQFRKFTDRTVGAFRISDEQLSMKFSVEMTSESERSRQQFYGRQSFWKRTLGAASATAYRGVTNLDNILIKRIKH